MTDENVVQLPTRLERLAVTLEDYLRRDAANRDEWIAIQEGICITLAEARGTFPSNIEFGQWCDANKFELNHQTRAAAIAMGAEPEALRKCLEVTERRSLEQIHLNEFHRFTDVRKTPQRRQEKLDLSRPSSPEERSASAAYDQIVGEGGTPTERAIRERAGVSSTPVRRVLASKKVEALLDPLTRAEMNATVLKRYELAVKKARAEIREELKAEVYAELDVYVRHVKDRSDRADRIIAAHDGVMSKEIFRKIKACLHPDHNTFMFAADALRIFSELEDALVKADEPETGAPPVPETAAELMAKRRR